MLVEPAEHRVLSRTSRLLPQSPRPSLEREENVKPGRPTRAARARARARCPRLLGPALAIAVGLALAAPASASAASTATGQAEAAAKPESAKKTKQGTRKRRAKLRALRAVSNLEPRALRRWPKTFGGLWLGRGGRIVVAFTSKARARAERLSSKLPAGKRLRAVRVDDSLASLRELQARMIADRQLDPPTVVADPTGRRPVLVPLVYDLDIDVKRNLVVAIVEQPVTAELTALFTARYGEDVVVEQGRLARPQGLIVCSARNACPPTLRSGLETVAESKTACSTAFTVSYPGANETLYGVLSAAHCGNPDADYLDDRFHSNSRYGEVIYEQQMGRVDAELHSVKGLFEDVAVWSSKAHWIYVDDPEKSGNVVAVSTYNGLPIGAKACKAGITTGKTCGQVQSKTFSPSYIPNATDFIRASYCSDNGDSGAGVFRPYGRRLKDAKPQYEALGVHSGGTEVEGGNCDPNKDYAVFGHIEFIFDGLPVKVTTTSP